jgi:Carboxypeptidase regulatory-like domain
MNRAKCLLFSILVLFTVNGTVFPQTSSTSLQGTVTDPSGSVIDGATVVLSNSESKLERTKETGTQGEYRFIALPPGTYTLTVTAKGFSRYQQTDLQLLVNTPATANVHLVENDSDIFPPWVRSWTPVAPALLAIRLAPSSTAPTLA